jgi:hypothetical protein
MDARVLAIETVPCTQACSQFMQLILSDTDILMYMPTSEMVCYNVSNVTFQSATAFDHLDSTLHYNHRDALAFSDYHSTQAATVVRHEPLLESHSVHKRHLPSFQRRAQLFMLLVARRVWRYLFACLVHAWRIKRNAILTCVFQKVTKLLVFFWVYAKTNKPRKPLPYQLVCFFALSICAAL